MVKKLWAIFFTFLVGFLVFYFTPQLDFQARVIFGTLAVAGVFWLTEIIPLFVTSFVIAFSLIVFAHFPSEEVFSSFFDPIIMLFLGGLVLARGFAKYNLDQFLAYKSLKLFGNKPIFVLLGLMFVSAFMSMWISNTAAVALLLPIALGILTFSKVKKIDPIYKFFPLGIAYAATLGGLGTFVGSPPNALAKKFLSSADISISFIEWMGYTVPFIIMMIFIIVLVLKFLFPPAVKELKLPVHQNKKLSVPQITVLITTVVTALLWLFGQNFGISASTAAMVPVLVFFGTQLLAEEDLRHISWSTLLLFGGGIALGEAVQNSGVDQIIAGWLEVIFVGLPLFILFSAVLIIGIIFTIVASNTGAAVLLLPIMISLSAKLNIDPKILILLATYGVSLDFILPVGTPPSALAYSTGYIKTREMAKAGLILTIFVVLIPACFAYFLW